MKLFKSLMLLSAIALIGLSSCNKEEEVAMDLEGTWDVTSWVNDGEQQVGASASFTAITWEFSEYNATTGGVMTETQESDSGAGTASISFTYQYELNKKGDELTLKFLTVNNTLEIVSIDGSTMTLEDSNNTYEMSKR